MDELQAANKKYFKFMFVRNPISRLLSVYFNKALAFNVSGIKDFGPDVKRRGGQVTKKCYFQIIFQVVLKFYILVGEIKKEDQILGK